MPQDAFVPASADVGTYVKATVVGRITAVEQDTVKIQTWTSPDGRSNIAVHVMHPHNATWERIAPAEWPPRVGDVWSDRHSHVWFVYSSQGGDTQPSIRNAHGAYLDDDIETFLLSVGPLQLMIRDGQAVNP